MSVEENIELATMPLSTGPRLLYAERGDPTGEAIVFLHGYSDSWFSYSRVLPLLTPSYHAFALTQRGHGDSDKPECCYTPKDFDRLWGRCGRTRSFLLNNSLHMRVRLSFVLGQSPCCESSADKGSHHDHRARHTPLADGVYYEDFEVGQVGAKERSHKRDQEPQVNSDVAP